jgi:hypothetical protein
MPAKLKTIVKVTKSEAEEQAPELPAGQGFARLIYTSITDISDEEDSSITESVQSAATVRQSLSPSGEAELVVDDYHAETEIIVQVEDAQGIGVTTIPEIKPVAVSATEYSVTVEYPESAIVALITRKEAPKSDALIVSGKFVFIGAPQSCYMEANLMFAFVFDQEQLKGIFNDDSASITDYAKLDANGLAKVSQLGLIPAEIFADGSFKISQAIPTTALRTTWVWFIIGPEKSFIGRVTVDEKLFSTPHTGFVIVLPEPVCSDKKDSATGVSASTATAPDTAGSAAKPCESSSPLNFDEQQVLDHPDQFSDDPGPYCEPFRNPQRILGERAFETVLRIEQPDIGAKASVKIDQGYLADWLNRTKWRTAEAERASGYVAATIQPESRSMLGRAWDAIRGVSQPVTAERISVPAIMVSPVPSVAFEKAILKKSAVRGQISKDNPVQWEGDASVNQATTLGKGHILEWRVRWRSNGYSLGDVAYTLPLAPRQVKRISKISWERRELALRSEIETQRDTLEQDTSRNRSYEDALRSNLNEWSKGGSKSSTTGAAGGIGFALGPVVIGGGAAHGSARSSAWQKGGRSLAASEQQSLRDSIRQYSESLRQRESTVVTEISQLETVEGVSEVLRNPNYCHSLTVIYYEILRHLRVETDLVGVRECLFVPFALRPFEDFERVIRWRDLISRGLLKRRYLWVFRHLEDIRRNFVGSTIPPGPRADHPITFLTGSIYVQIGIERPRSHADPAEDLNEMLWHPFAALLGAPFREIVRNMHERQEAQRDRYYQSEIAPTMAIGWADKLRLTAYGRGVGILLDEADFTLASNYGYNRTVRIDFTYVPSQSETLTRRDLRNLRITAVDLPPGSVANLKRVSIKYRTDQFDRTVTFNGAEDDLVNVETGTADTLGANAYLRLTDWEETDLRQEIAETGEDMLVHLNEHLEHYHKVIWWNMDRDKLYMLLDGFRLSASDGRSLSSVVEREPLGILGNTLVFKAASGAFLGVDGHASAEDMLNHYLDHEARSEPIRISLPTDGFYAQAIMDKCEACEEHYGTVDWVLGDSEPGLVELGVDALSSRRADPANLAPSAMSESLINLPDVPSAPDPAGFTSLLNAITKSDAFRDMAGLAGTQAAAQAAMKTAADLAGQFGGKAVDLRKAELATQQAPQKLNAIDKASKKGMIDDVDKKDLAKKALNEMNMDAVAADLKSDPAIREVLDRASNVPGNPIEVTRRDKDGEQVVKVGGSVTLAQANVALPSIAPNSSLVGDAAGPLDLSDTMKAYINAVAAPAAGLCVDASLAYFTAAMKQAGVTTKDIQGTDQTYEVPAIAAQNGNLISLRAFLTLWFSNSTASNWGRLPSSCRGTGAPGALLYADLVEGRQIKKSVTGWPAGMTAGAFLQLWPSQVEYEQLRDNGVVPSLGHSCVFHDYVAGDATKIMISDQMGVSQEVMYPYLGLGYVLAANLSKGRLLVVI